MDEPQIDDKGPQVRTERRAGRHVGRRFGPERLAAAGAEPAIQRHPRDVRLDWGKLDVVVGVERGLRDARQVGPAMSAMIGQDVALARRIGMQGTVRSGMRCASACAPARRRWVGRRLPALRGRRAGIVRRLRWQFNFSRSAAFSARNAPLSASRRDSRAVNISTCRFSAAIVSAASARAHWRVPDLSSTSLRMDLPMSETNTVSLLRQRMMEDMAARKPHTRTRPIVDTATADAQNLRLLRDRQVVLTVDHRFALSNPALLSAPSKKSFSSVSSPIFACSDFTSTAAAPLRCHRRHRKRQPPRSRAAPSTM